MLVVITCFYFILRKPGDTRILSEMKGEIGGLWYWALNLVCVDFFCNDSDVIPFLLDDVILILYTFS